MIFLRQGKAIGIAPKEAGHCVYVTIAFPCLKKIILFQMENLGFQDVIPVMEPKSLFTKF